MMRKIPYGISDYKKIREQDYIYIDKTQYIEKIENTSTLIYVRPRRFGKTLFTSMMSYYYDIQEEENFEKLFKGMYIYNNQAKNRNAYYILNFNFSGMNISGSKTSIEIEKSFNDNVYLSCQNFIKKYNLDIKLQENKVAATTLLALLSQFQTLNKENKIYIIIDEYDHFTNGMLEGNVLGFLKVLGQGGFVRAFYEVIKRFAEGVNSVVDRFFATGVAPLTLDSLTSGFNIATNISLEQKYTAMCGLTEQELKILLEELQMPENILEYLKQNYDGYRFSTKSEEHTFNTTLVMYYLKYYEENGEPPEDPIDGNLATTGDKIEGIVNLMNPEANYKKLMELMKEGQVSGGLIKQFELNDSKFDTYSFLSLLFYNGYVTIKDVGMSVQFSIPNYVSEVLYATYFTAMISKNEEYNIETQNIKDAIIELGEKGDIEPITQIVQNFLMYQSTRDKENFNEKTLKYLYSMFLSLTKQFHVYGEFPAMQGFADVYVKKTERRQTKKNIQEIFIRK